MLIAALGPAVFLLGLLWAVLRLVLGDADLSFRGIIFAPAHQMMLVGIIVAAICLPVAAGVSRATAEQLRLPGFEAKRSEGNAESRPRRRRSYQSYN